MLGVTPDQIGMFDGKLFVIHEPKKCLTFAELGTANRLFRLSFPRDESFQSGISAEFTYDHPYNSLPNADRTDLGVYYPIVGHACHIVVAEIDEETGRVQFPRYIAVHDTGTIVNPKLVDGQIRGGIAQGIGTALYEQYLYDEEGQLLNASLSEYLVPSASEIPDIEIAHLETPSPFTQRGIKGCGEGGRLASIPAIASAIDDAFADEGVFVNILPVTPSALHRLRATAREDVSRRTQ